MELNSVFRQNPELVVRKTGSEYIIVPLQDKAADMKRLFTLNETGAFIWDQIDGEKDVGQLIRCLMEEFEVDEPTALADVVGLLEEMEGKVILPALPR